MIIFLCCSVYFCSNYLVGHLYKHVDKLGVFGEEKSIILKTDQFKGTFPTAKCKEMRRKPEKRSECEQAYPRGLTGLLLK